VQSAVVNPLRNFDRFLIFAFGSTGLSVLFYVIVAMVLSYEPERGLGFIKTLIGMIWMTLGFGLLVYGPLLVAAIVVGFPAWAVLVPRMQRSGMTWRFSVLLGAISVAFLSVFTCVLIGLAFDLFDLTLRFAGVSLLFCAVGAVSGAIVGLMLYRKEKVAVDVDGE
jgi:hypothetical protein